MIRYAKLSTLLFIIIAINLLASCSFNQKQAAPVVDLRNQIAEQQGYHVVQRGETLYFIAWRFGKDFLELAQLNKLQVPYSLTVGQKLYLSGKTQYYNYKKTPGKATATASQKARYQPKNISPVGRWYAPTKGTVVQAYTKRVKGINIAGTQGEPIHAVAAGTVVYAGSGLRGYGNLILIKHNDLYLSAYAHNRKFLVKDGQQVRANQKIAEMGSSGADRVMLHFELRKRGKPVRIVLRGNSLIVK
jgi:lipoprotein NlpD